jgi:dihydroorotate dehydrogenase electron transfer subunit
MAETVGTVESNVELAPGFRLLTLVFDSPIEVLPGQFAMLKPSGSLEPLLRRALAVYSTPEPNRCRFLYQVLGRGTQALSRADNGARVDALIPLGNSWPVDGRTAGEHERKQALIVAGGIGSASVLMLCEELKQRRVETRIFFGAASESAAIGCGLADFQALGLPVSVTTDNGSLGERGFVTGPLERYLHESRLDARVYACGPWGMMRAVSSIARQRGLECYASLEAPMGCGFGVCVGCVVAVKVEGGPGYDSYKRVCVDGSIFAADSIQWDVDAMMH